MTSPGCSAGTCTLLLRQHGSCLSLQGSASPAHLLHSSSGRHVSPARLLLTRLGCAGPCRAVPARWMLAMSCDSVHVLAGTLPLNVYIVPPAPDVCRFWQSCAAWRVPSRQC